MNDNSSGVSLLPSWLITGIGAIAMFGTGVRAQEPAVVSMSQVHPRTMITLGATIGQQDFEVNTGSDVVSASNDAFALRLRGEHFYESEFGLHVTGSLSFADDLDSTDPRSGLDSQSLFVGVAYRATINDDFRMPVRFGPFFHRSEQESSSPDGTVERSVVGVRLSAEPEYIIFQRVDGDRLTEFSAFAEFGCGAGPAQVEDDVDSEDAYAFQFNWEIGLRYRFASGLMVGLSYAAQKTHYGASESYSNPAIVFNGVDDDFGGIVLSAGLRF